MPRLTRAKWRDDDYTDLTNPWRLTPASIQADGYQTRRMKKDGKPRSHISVCHPLLLSGQKLSLVLPSGLLLFEEGGSYE